jgi:hypothetical protein
MPLSPKGRLRSIILLVPQQFFISSKYNSSYIPLRAVCRWPSPNGEARVEVVLKIKEN